MPANQLILFVRVRRVYLHSGRVGIPFSAKLLLPNSYTGLDRSSRTIRTAERTSEMYRLLRSVILIALCGFCVAKQRDVQYMSALLDTGSGTVTLVPGRQQKAVAWGSFEDAIHQDG